MFLQKIFFKKSSSFFLFFGTKPKKQIQILVIQIIVRAEIIDEGPGTEVTKILFINTLAKVYSPGSEISGDPASEIKTQFLFFNKYN